MRYPSPGKRLFGISVPLGAIRTERGWRVGEYPDLVPFAGLCTELGAGLLQILPVNDTGSQSSPYSALSAFALHPLYIRVHDLPEAVAAPQALAELDAFAARAQPGERFPYGASLDAKLAALRAVYEARYAKIAADPALAAFIAERPWVKTYAVFKRLKSGYGEKAWNQWPAHRDPGADDIARLWDEPAARAEQLFHVWVQMTAARQFGDAAARVAEAGVALLGDIPILMNEDSADVWAGRRFFDAGNRAGAPPDMYSSSGQNWGFPIYDWEAMASDNYSFWRARVSEADRYYSAFRIDHVLGFFRIWALGAREETGSLGRFVPGARLDRAELEAIGFSAERLRWLSEPHISGDELRAAGGAPVDRAIALALDRIGGEDLYLFKPAIRGEADISALGDSLRGAASPESGPETVAGLVEFLKQRWRDRALLPLAGDGFAATWHYRDSRAWKSLSDSERQLLSGLLADKDIEAELGWEKRGRELLAMLKGASAMLPCAEDLGAVPDCVPKVLTELGIPGLRVPRWMRYWNEPGQPFKPLSEYQVLSACTPSVHDTSTLRAWWEEDDGRDAFVRAYCPEIGTAPETLDPKTAAVVMAALARAPSILFVPQLQDLLDLSAELRSTDPRADRINVPGTVGDCNWTWRMPLALELLDRAEAWKMLTKKTCRR